jgi:SulP family sulfate permease
LKSKAEKKLKQVIIYAIGINKVYSSALHALTEIVDEYEKRDIEVIFAGVKGPVRDLLKRSGLEDTIGPEQFYLDISMAVDSLDNEGEEESHLSNKK